MAEATRSVGMVKYLKEILDMEKLHLFLCIIQRLDCIVQRCAQ